MAEQEAGFLANLTGSAVNETEIARARVAEAIANPNQGNAGLRQMMFGLGQQAAGGLGAGARGLATAAFDRREGEGFLQATARGTQEGTDSITAKAVGITPTELRSRRRIRRELSSLQGDASVEGRLKMAQKAAKIAQEEGDSASLGRALKAIQDLKKEKAEFDKLQANTKRTNIQTAEDAVQTGFRPDGDPVSGVIGNEKGTIEEVGGVGTGMWYADKNKKLVFEPFGDNLTLEDPTRASDETTDSRVRKLTSKKERELIRNLVVSNDSAMRKSRGVISTLHDLFKKGGSESVVGASGDAVTFIDNAVRNVRGFVGAFTSSEALARDRGQKRNPDGSIFDVRSWMSQTAGEVTSDIWQVLPEEFRRTGAAATQYRAQIMEMAYMAARLAEPSNRGLSDNDIKNALIRIAGDSSNPQSIIRRFIEMQADSAAELETRLSTIKGSISGVPDEEIERILAGNALPKYRKDLQKLYDDFGISINEAGRATFPDPIDTDVQPGEGSQIPTVPENAVEIEDDGEFLEAILNQG